MVNGLAETPTAIAAKQDLRLIAKQRRAECFRRHGSEAGEDIARHGLAFLDPSPGSVISAYAAIGEEIDPLPLAMLLLSQSFRVVLPVMNGKGRPLLFREWRPGDRLEEKVWGIREPLASAPEAEPQIMLVPLLAFDRRGYRLGYGGGFYDRTLASLRARHPVAAVGLAYDEQELEAVPHLDHDQRLDWVLTPSGPIRCRAD
jgi:5-formyltetrahydrofolate cyclo-ligase